MIVLECYQLGELMIKTYIGKTSPDREDFRKDSVLWLQFTSKEFETCWFESPYLTVNGWSIKRKIASAHAHTIQRCVDEYNSLGMGHLDIFYSTHNLKIASIDSISHSLEKRRKVRKHKKKTLPIIREPESAECTHPLDKINTSGTTPRCTNCGQFVKLNFIP